MLTILQLKCPTLYPYCHRDPEHFKSYFLFECETDCLPHGASLLDNSSNILEVFINFKSPIFCAMIKSHENETDWSQALVLWQALGKTTRPRRVRLWNLSHYFYTSRVPRKCKDLNVHIVGSFVVVSSLLCSHCSHVLSVHQGVFGVHLLLQKSRGLFIT